MMHGNTKIKFDHYLQHHYQQQYISHFMVCFIFMDVGFVRLFFGRPTFLLPVEIYSCFTLVLRVLYILNNCCAAFYQESTVIQFKFYRMIKNLCAPDDCTVIVRCTDFLIILYIMSCLTLCRP